MNSFYSAASVVGTFIGNAIQVFSGGLGLGLGMGLGFGITIGSFFDIFQGSVEAHPKKTENK